MARESARNEGLTVTTIKDQEMKIRQGVKAMTCSDGRKAVMWITKANDIYRGGR